MDLGSVVNVDCTVGTKGEQVSSFTPGVNDDLVLFRLSQQIDRVRDTAKWLLSKGVADQAVTDRLALTCNRAVDGVSSELDVALRAEMDRLQLRQVPGSSLSEVFAVAAQVSAWIDSVHYSPAFELSQRVKHASSEKVLAELASGATPSDVSDVPTVSAGHYL